MLDDVHFENLLETLSEREKSQMTGEGLLEVIKQAFSPNATPEQMAKSLGKLSESLKLNGISVEQQSLIIGAM